MQRINPGFLKKYTSVIVLFFAALNFAFFFLNRYYQFTFPYLALAGYTTFAMIFGLLVNDAVMRETKIIGSILNFSVFKFLGRISYGLYILHWPVYLLTGPYLLSWVQGYTSGWLMNFSVSVLATLAAIAISWVSFTYFESYFLKKKDKFV